MVVTQTSLSVAGVGSAAARRAFARRPYAPAAASSRQKPCRIACCCICRASTEPPAPGSGGSGDACRWLRARGGIVIFVRAGAGRIVSGRPASELTFGDVTGEDGWCGGVEGVDAYAVVCMEMDAMTGLASRRRGLTLGARRSSHGTSTMISTSSSESSTFFRVHLRNRHPWLRAVVFLRGLVVGVCRGRFPFLRGDTRA